MRDPILIFGCFMFGLGASLTYVLARYYVGKSEFEKYREQLRCVVDSHREAFCASHEAHESVLRRLTEARDVAVVERDGAVLRGKMILESKNKQRAEWQRRYNEMKNDRDQLMGRLADLYFEIKLQDKLIQEKF